MTKDKVWGKKKVLVTGLVILVIIIVGLVVGNVILVTNQKNQVDDRQDEESEHIENTEDYEIVVELHGAEGSSSTSASGSGK